MNDRRRQQDEIQHHEQWLDQFATPGPDTLTLERIKFMVRRECRDTDAPSPGDTQAALSAAKVAVRRELAKTASCPRTVIFHPWPPLMVAAASLAMAFVTLWSDAGADRIADPELAAFVNVMSRPTDDTITALWELEDGIAALAAVDSYQRTGQGADPLLFEVGDDLGEFSREFAELEEES